MSTVTVIGIGRIQRPADRATLRATLNAEASEPSAAIAALTEQHNRWYERLEQLPVAWHRTAAIVVTELTEWVDGRTLRKGFVASSTTTIGIEEIARLGEVIAGIYGESFNLLLEGPAWSLSNRAELSSEARVRAAEDARACAADDAQGMGMRLGPLRWIREQPLSGGGAVLMARSADGGMPIAVAAEEVEVTITVRAQFECLPDPDV